MKIGFKVILIGLTLISSSVSAENIDDLPKCIVEDCQGGTWQKLAIHWRIRRTSDDLVLEYGPGASWNDETRKNATLKICHREYLNRVCGSCEIRSVPYTMPACTSQ